MPTFLDTRSFSVKLIEKTFILSTLSMALLAGLFLGTPAQSEIAIDPQAQEVLENFSNTLQAASTIEVHPYVNVEVRAGGMKNQSETKGDLFLERPNKVSLDVVGGKFPFTLKCDGTTLYTFVPSMAAYTKQSAPEQAAGFLGGIEGRLLNQQLPFLGSVFAPNPFGFLIQNATGVDYVGKEDYEGTSCHRIRLHNKPYILEALIDAGPQPLLRKIIPDKEGLRASVAMRLPGAEISMEIRFDDWVLGQAVEAEKFAFAPPEWADERESFMQAQPQDAALALEKKKAPDLSLPLLSGEQFNLEEHRGKVVILDFWASWCRPCVMGLPIIDQVAETYEEKGVVFVAVNVEGSEPEALQAFLDQYEYDFPIGIDKTKMATAKYRVGPIPQTVLIDKEGTVQKVVLGLDPQLKENLSQDLDKLLAGESLAD
jgi:thiol-disulfide isomerase/thioredoxin